MQHNGHYGALADGRDPITKLALEYLEGLGVPTSTIRSIAVTGMYGEPWVINAVLYVRMPESGAQEMTAGWLNGDEVAQPCPVHYPLRDTVGVPRCPVDGQWCGTCRIGKGNGVGGACARRAPSA
jgi:hypothetical protein